MLLHTVYRLCYLFSDVKQIEAVGSLACVALGIEVTNGIPNKE